MVKTMKDVREMDFKYPDAKPMRDLKDQKILIHEVDVSVLRGEDTGDLKPAYFKIGKSADKAAWYYSTGEVLFDQGRKVSRLIEKAKEPVEVVVAERQSKKRPDATYLVLE